MSEIGAPPPRPSTARLSAAPLAVLRDLPRPRAVAVSFWCWLIASLLVGASVAVGSTRIEDMRAEFARLAGIGDPEATQATIDRVADASVLVVIGTGGLLGVLGLLLAGPMRAGRGWARFCLAVVAVLALVYAVFVTTAVTEEMLGDLRVPVAAGLLAFAATATVAAVCTYLSGTRTWFHRPKGL
jgi:hypothetical protein